MATRSRARHFHATAKALAAAADARGGGSDGVLLTAQVSDVDIASIVGGAGSIGELPAEGIDGAMTLPPVPVAATRPVSEVRSEDLLTLHEELRWAESKLMQASERLAEAQEARRKDLVALAIMRRELLASFGAERAWLGMSMRYFRDLADPFGARERELAELVENGVRTEQVIHELAVVRTERKLYELALVQTTAQLARIDDNEATSEYQVASEAYDREPDGAAMREVARLRSHSTKARREATRLRTDANAQLDQLGIVDGVGEVTAANAFLAAEYEGDERAAERMDRVRGAQIERELSLLPEPEASWRAGLKHPVHFMRARRSTGVVR